MDELSGQTVASAPSRATVFVDAQFPSVRTEKRTGWASLMPEVPGLIEVVVRMIPFPANPFPSFPVGWLCFRSHSISLHAPGVCSFWAVRRRGVLTVDSLRAFYTLAFKAR